MAGLAARDEVRELVQRIVDGVNSDLARFEQVRAFAVLPRDFLAEEDEVTPTMKLRRKICAEHFADGDRSAVLGLVPVVRVHDRVPAALCDQPAVEREGGDPRHRQCECEAAPEERVVEAGLHRTGDHE